MPPHDPAGPPPDDPWLSALGEVARGEAAEADAPLPESGPLRPLDADERASIVAAVLAARGASEAERPPLPLAEVAAPSGPRRWGAMVAAAVVLAAVVAAFALRPGPVTVPAYAVEDTAGAQATRGDDGPRGSVTTYAPGTRFRLVLRPATPPPGPMLATVALRGPDGPVPWQPPLEVGHSGSVKAEGAFDGPLALPPGDYVATFSLRMKGAPDAARTLEYHFRIEGP